MRLRKDDPVYYKEKINKLIREAKENGLKVSINKMYENDYLTFESKETNERAKIKIDD
ncbi:hypothetical protein [Clostridium perfringens]|uniref:hypothetical protein n=1 Tax=Clostridium perfringens TaxID=1502 RepID=UPI003CF98328